MTQPALSAMLKKLEAEVGSPLLHRTGRGVELTDAGRVFLVHADEACRAADGAIAAVREVVGLERGSIRVGGGATATTYLLPRVVSAIRKARPGMRFSVREAGSAAVAAAVAAGELDLGIVTEPAPRSMRAELSITPLVEDEMRLLLPPGHALLSGGTKKRRGGGDGAGTFAWRDLAGESVVGFEAGAAVRELIDRAAGAAGVKLEYVMELRSIESIKSMVGAGIGVGFVSRFALGAGEGLSCREGRLTRALVLVRRADRALSHAAAEFERELLRSVGRRR